MKKMLCILVCLFLVIPMASAEPQTIDLESMSLDELMALSNEIQTAIVNASVENIDGYNVVTTYSEYARNPDSHVGEQVRFNGEIVQVVEGVENNIYRVAMKGDTNSIFYVTYLPTEGEAHILEEDKVTIFGEFSGLYTYDSTLGGQITVPWVIADSITEEIQITGEYAATRQDPVPIGATVRYDGSSYSNECVTDFTVENVIRGDGAYQQAKAAYRWTDKPDDGKEYIIVSIKTAAIASENDQQAEIDDYDFVFVSETGVEYERETISALEPKLVNLYPGAENTGVVVGLINKDDFPNLVYLKNSDNPIWFDLNKRVPIQLPDDIILNTLQKGDKNDDVKQMQMMLIEMGYLNGTADGDFGAKTEAAIMQYQTDMGVEATGIADEATLRLILTMTLPD